MDRVVECRCNNTTAKIATTETSWIAWYLLEKLGRVEQALGFSLLTAEAGWSGVKHGHLVGGC
jgi:hypothetical protein